MPSTSKKIMDKPDILNRTDGLETLSNQELDTLYTLTFKRKAYHLTREGYIHFLRKAGYY